MAALDTHPYIQRKNAFRTQLISDLTRTCYVVLLFKFFLFNDSTLLLGIRLLSTRMIKEFYPKTLETMAEYHRSENAGGARRTPTFPLSFNSGALSSVLPTRSGPENEETADSTPEPSSAEDIQRIQQRMTVSLSSVLFHATVTFNIIIIIIAIVFPMDFTKMESTRRFTLMIDLLSEYRDFSLYNNITSNIFNVFLEILVFLIQFSLLQMTTVDDPKKMNEESLDGSLDSSWSDGFDGQINVATINIKQTFDKLRSRISSSES